MPACPHCNMPAETYGNSTSLHHTHSRLTRCDTDDPPANPFVSSVRKPNKKG